jgi:hypothetical protein
MNQPLREELLDGIVGEGWDDEEKARCVRAVGELPNGAEIPYEHLVDPDPEYVGDDVPLHPVAELIEYFGIEHMVTVDDGQRTDYGPTGGGTIEGWLVAVVLTAVALGFVVFVFTIGRAL